MTVLFTGIIPRLFIVMAADSATTLQFEDHREFGTVDKVYCFPGVGCVGTWGARDGNLIGQHLGALGISRLGHSVHVLADTVDTYLRGEYRPHEIHLDDVGYHVAGFDREGVACVYHVFWGFDRPRPDGQMSRKYEKYQHAPDCGGSVFLYNGRNDLADAIVRLMLDQIAGGQETRFSLHTPIGLACFADFVTRVAAEITPEVGPPFYIHLISPSNCIYPVRNESWSPVPRDTMERALHDLGYQASEPRH